MKTLRTTLDRRLELLGRCSIFARVREEERELLAETVMLRRFDPGEHLFEQGDEARGFYVVITGRVKVYRFGRDEREQVLHLVGPGDFCAAVPVFQGKRYPASGSAVGDATALHVPRDEFLELGRRRPDLLFGMLAAMSYRLRQFVDLIDDLSLKEVSARLAKHLLDRSIQDGSDNIELSVTKTLLAYRLGTISETLSRTLKRMQQRGVIEVDGATIHIRDREQLVELASGQKL